MNAITIDRSEQLARELHALILEMDTSRWRDELEVSVRERLGELDGHLTTLLDDAAHSPRFTQLRERLDELAQTIRSSMPTMPSSAERRADELRAQWMAFRARLETSYQALASTLRSEDVHLPQLAQDAREAASSVFSRIVSVTRVLLGLAYLGVISVPFFIALIICLPLRMTRIHICNLFGTLAGRGMLRIAGCPVSVKRLEEGRSVRPAIYISNHTSLLDIFPGMWLSPMGTVGVAKKEVIFYPFIGQLYFLSGHLRIDRSRRERAVESMQQLAEYVREKQLSIFIWPEGTRARDGRLQPFKKGVVHLAISTGLPIVPMVVRGMHHAMKKGSVAVTGHPVDIELLDPIYPTDWSTERMDEHLSTLEQVFIDALPHEQRPLGPLRDAA